MLLIDFIKLNRFLVKYSKTNRIKEIIPNKKTLSAGGNEKKMLNYHAFSEWFFNNFSNFEVVFEINFQLKNMKIGLFYTLSCCY